MAQPVGGGLAQDGGRDGIGGCQSVRCLAERAFDEAGVN
jgi:hypothetical protein